MARYEQALEAKQKTMKKIDEDPLGAVNQVLISWKPELMGGRYSQHQIDMAIASARLMFSELALSETYFWSDTICDIITVAAESLPDDTVITKDIVPDICGFTWLEKKIKLQSLNDDEMPTNLKPIIEELQLSAISWFRNETYMAVTLWVAVPGNTLQAPYYTATFTFGETFQRYSGDIAIGVKIFVSSLLFLQQQLLESRVGLPGRALQRRLKRNGTSQNNAQVKVITLRRPHHTSSKYNEEEDRKHVEWSCQWLVKGFWRSQYYASDKSHRNIWIFPYIKGPDDKPFQPKKETIMAVVR